MATLKLNEGKVREFLKSLGYKNQDEMSHETLLEKVGLLSSFIPSRRDSCSDPRMYDAIEKALEDGVTIKIVSDPKTEEEPKEEPKASKKKASKKKASVKKEEPKEETKAPKKAPKKEEPKKAPTKAKKEEPKEEAKPSPKKKVAVKKEEPKKEEPKKATSKKKEESPKPAKVSKAPKGDKGKGEGVIGTITKLVLAASAKSPVSKATIHAELVKRFPDKSPESMMTTLNAQLPSRLRYNGLNVTKNEKGYWATKGE